MLTGRDFRGEPDAAVAAVRAVVRVSRMLERSLDGLNLPHYRVLAAVSAGEEIASRVAARLALGRPAVSAAVAALAERGLLVRLDVEGDQRAAGLSLTDEGWEVLAQADAAMSAELRILAAKTGHPELVIDTLGLLNDAISAVHAERLAAKSAAPKPGAPKTSPAHPGGSALP